MTDWTDITPQLAPALTAVVGLLAYTRGTGSRSTRLKLQVDILSELPKDHASYPDLSAYIRTRIDELVAAEPFWSFRRLARASSALLLAPGLAYLAIRLFQNGTWWSYALSGFVGLMIVGAIEVVFIDPSADELRIGSGAGVPEPGDDPQKLDHAEPNAAEQPPASDPPTPQRPTSEP